MSSYSGAPDSPLTGWGTPQPWETLEPLNHFSTQLANAIVVKTGPGRLFGFTVTNTKSSAQFVLLFDAATVPADTAVPVLAKSVPASDAVGFEWIPPRSFGVGLVLCNSSTQTTKTIGSADCFFDVQFI